MLEKINQHAISTLSVILCFFVLAAVNFNLLQPQSNLAIFVGLGLVLCFLVYPAHSKLKSFQPLKCVDWVLAVASAVCCGYVVLQTEPAVYLPWFDGWRMVINLEETVWYGGISLGNRAGIETTADFWIGLFGLLLVLEATRRSIGWIVPILAVLFVAHSYYCHVSNRFGYPPMPDALLPHAGQSAKDIVSTTFLQTLGVFGPAANVMFKYVFLFVVFGSFLEMSGATQFIMDFAQKVFGRIQGGPAQVSVLSSGMMGSLSGSAVANAVTTGAFTIPMMRNVGFPRHVAGAVEASSASGGALMPPVMGAAAYMMLEIVEPQPSYLEIVKAALIPAVLYYISLMVIVHFYSGMLGAKAIEPEKVAARRIWRFEAVVFFAALAVLVGLLLLSFSPFRAVTGALLVILVLTAFRPSLEMANAPRAIVLVAALTVSVGYWFFFTEPMHENSNWRTIFTKAFESAIVGMFGLLAFGLIHPAWRPGMKKALLKSSKAGISLVAASACVGIVIGIVQQTGIATDFSSNIKNVVETNLFLALLGIMACSLVLGMGVPSVVCYLLMATLMGSLLGDMGVIPLAAHLFIFYFGMMSMVTPPVALAGYAAASIAEAPIMKTSFAAFRFSLVGFTLPFMFVYQPNLLLMGTEEHPLTAFRVTLAIVIALMGIVSLAGGIVGYFDFIWRRSALSWLARIQLFVGAALLLSPDVTIGGVDYGIWANIIGALNLLTVILGVALLPPIVPKPRDIDPDDEPAETAAPATE